MPKTAGLALVGLALALPTGLPTVAQAAPRMTAEQEAEAGFVDPRKRRPPRAHRFRLGAELDYARLSAAVDDETGEVQRFHFAPLQLDFAYQAQLFKHLMIRPSFGFGANVANTLEAMPMVVHPQLFAGYQGRMFGVGFGYGYLWAPITRKDARSAIRGGLGQPIITNNHHVGGEVSITTRVHKRREAAPGAGELSIIIRVAGLKSQTQHFTLDEVGWRALLTFNLGWYFGDGRRKQARARARARAK